MGRDPDRFRIPVVLRRNDAWSRVVREDLVTGNQHDDEHLASFNFTLYDPLGPSDPIVVVGPIDFRHAERSRA